MIEHLWEDILDRFGEDVILHGRAEDVVLRAIVQPVLDQGREQETAGPLGLGRQDRFRYLGPAACPLDLDSVVEWRGKTHRVRAAHLAGTGICPHWWAVLCPGEEAG